MVEEFVRKRYGKEASIIQLAGDASERKFYRISIHGRSFVLMQCASNFEDEKHPYIDIWRFLKRHGFRIPEILEVHAETGVIVLSDLGDTLLQNLMLNLIEEKRVNMVKALCRKAIDIIVDLQLKGTEALDETCIASKYALDRDRFIFELNFFYEHYVLGLLDLRLTEVEEGGLRSWFNGLAGDVSGFGSVLCHRDFHSRNLIVVDAELYMTDFQDARLGPYTYDLASFLRDSYVSYEEDVINEMLDYYIDTIRERMVSHQSILTAKRESRFQQFLSGPDSEKRNSFRREFDLTCIQRNIKALGTFAFQSRVRKNHYYLRYVPATLNYIRKNLDKLSITMPPRNLILLASPIGIPDEKA
ncbi:MAG: phosphotransferase [Acidobacteriota bacterium]